MKSSLEILRDCMRDYLRGLADLKSADIFTKNQIRLDIGGKALGIKIIVGEPKPLKVSKYTAGTTFSEVAIPVSVQRQNEVASKIPEELFYCEIVSKALHNWTPPILCGYGKITLAENEPWREPEAPPNCSLVEITFKTQSLIQ